LDSRIEELRRRLERDPGSRLFAQLAEECRKAGDHGEAIRVARAGLALHPNYPSARLTLGRALLESGDASGAREELENALREAPDNILAGRFLAQALEAQGDLGGALARYAATLKMAPGDRLLEGQIAALQERLGAGQESRMAPADAVTGPMPQVVVPPPLPPKNTASAVSTHEPVGAERVAVEPARTLPRMQAPDTVVEDEEAPTRPRSPAPRVGGGGDAEAPQGAVGAPESPAGATPFSSSTLAELYFRQGLLDRAVEVYRQLLVVEPGNTRARARLEELVRLSEGPQAAGEAKDAGRAARRILIERTIARLEALLAVIRGT
jgi:tetratricopeptide (TPR) repeat protein